MNGLDLFRSPKTAADEIADIVSAQCPPVVPENCDAFSCRECWLAWLTTGEPLDHLLPGPEALLRLYQRRGGAHKEETAA